MHALDNEKLFLIFLVWKYWPERRELLHEPGIFDLKFIHARIVRRNVEETLNLSAFDIIQGLGLNLIKNKVERLETCTRVRKMYRRPSSNL